MLIARGEKTRGLLEVNHLYEIAVEKSTLDVWVIDRPIALSCLGNEETHGRPFHDGLESLLVVQAILLVIPTCNKASLVFGSGIECTTF